MPASSVTDSERACTSAATNTYGYVLLPIDADESGLQEYVHSLHCQLKVWPSRLCLPQSKVLAECCLANSPVGRLAQLKVSPGRQGIPRCYRGAASDPRRAPF